MSEQALDLRRSLQIVRRHKIIVGVVRRAWPARWCRVHSAQPADAREPVRSSCYRPPRTTSSTQVIIASSDKVLPGALHHIRPAMSLQTLRSRVQAKSLTANIISIGAQGKTAAQAEGTANAVANSFVAYLSSKNSAAGQVQARLLESATNATGTSLPVRLLVNGGLGALLGALIGAIGALALWPRRPAAAGARRDSRCHRGARAGIDPRRAPNRCRWLGQAARGLRARRRPCVEHAQGPAPSGSD